MPSRSHTTVIQRILERRAERPPVTDETTATIAVMVRGIPPPKALLVCADALLRAQIEQRITADMLDLKSVEDEHEAMRCLEQEFQAVVLTDSPEMVRRIRNRASQRTPFVVYLAQLDETDERAVGLAAGADECVGRRTSDLEMDARLSAARRIAELETVLRITLTENRKLAATDELTRLASRRFFTKQFPREIERAARYGHALTLILCDIDFFKKINETLGHAGGDEILKQFGARLQQDLRRGIDWVARLGGEEFAIVLPETGCERSREVARKIRSNLNAMCFRVEGRNVEVTASFGLCGLDRVPAGERQLARRMLKVADAALYRSKGDGRNRVTVARLSSIAESTKSLR